MEAVEARKDFWISGTPLDLIGKFKRAVMAVNRDLMIVFLVISVAGMLNIFVVQDAAFLNVYNVVIVIAAFLAGKRQGTLAALFCVLVVVLLAYFNPQLFGAFAGEWSPIYRWTSIAAWAGLLLLTSTLVGTLYERQKRAFLELQDTYYGILEILNTFISKDKYTQHHCYRVSLYAVKIGRQMGFSAERLEDIRAAGLLHDLGKLDVSRDILYKAARLSQQEFEEMKTHVVKGYRIMSAVGGSLRRILPIILSHHDRFDGSGYNPTKGEEIPLEGRILAVADVYDALTTDRPYRKALSPYEARKVIVEGANKDFDPAVVTAFLAAFARNELEIPESQMYPATSETITV